MGKNMLNYLWAAMVIGGILAGVVQGNASAVTEALLEAAQEAVQLGLTLLGIVSFWCGIMEIAKEAGLIEKMSRRLWPLIHWLFPQIPEGHAAGDAISLNFIANILGLGWAATPAGLKAMEELQSLQKEEERSTASDAMCTFLVMNISSLQLIPVNIIAYRSMYGSTAPSAVIGPAIFATAISTITAAVLCRIFMRKKADSFP